MTEQQIQPIELNSTERELYDRIAIRCDQVIKMTKRHNPPGTLFSVTVTRDQDLVQSGHATTLSTALARVVKATNHQSLA